jgi:hypothetical protein
MHIHTYILHILLYIYVRFCMRFLCMQILGQKEKVIV